MFIPVFAILTMQQTLLVITLLGLNVGAILWMGLHKKKGTRY